ncbi:MAG: hypothetical protein ACRYGI_12595 [Janthinobacterium lividum]
MLTREQISVLAPVVHDAVVLRDGIYHLRLMPGFDMPLVNSQGPLKSFAEGWRPGLVLTVLHPVLLLEFLHESGQAAFWLLDTDGMFIGNDFTALPAHLFEAVCRRGRPMLNWLRAMAAPGIACVQPASVTALLLVHLDIRRELAKTICAIDRTTMLSDAELGPVQDRSQLLLAPDARMAPPEHFAITQGGQPIQLGAGWRVDRVTTLFAPVIVLELLHEEGHQGVWYVDRQIEMLGNSALQLSGAMRLHLQCLCMSLFDELRDRVIMAPALTLTPDTSRFLDMAQMSRDDLLSFYFLCAGLNDRPAHNWALTDSPTAPMSYSVPVAGGGKVVIDPDHARRTCLRFLRDELFRQIGTGTMIWPSPVDGQDIVVVPKTFYIDDLCFAYQLHDERHGLTFYVIALEWFFRSFALYFPSADLVVGVDAASLQVARSYTEKAGQLLLRHVTLYGADLVPSLQQPPTEIVHAFRGLHAIHLGHFVWQDLSGLSYMVDAFPAKDLPRCYVFDTRHHPEIYGPIDEIFPELAGKVVRSTGSFSAHIPHFYRNRQSVIKSTGISVPGQVRRRIGASLRRSARWQGPVSRAAQAHAEGAVVVIGLRMGNRTIEDMGGFADRLVSMLANQLGTVTIVIDGHNSMGDEPGSTYTSFGDTPNGSSSFMQRELVIAELLERRYRGTAVSIVNNIDRPVLESVVWCSKADFFVAPWGAALAKYRWVCNTPGLVTSGRWNLEERGDLEIYNHPAAMDDPSPMIFNAAASATDIVKPGATAGDRSNYMLDETMVFAQVRTLIANHVDTRLNPVVVTSNAVRARTANFQVA